MTKPAVFILDPYYPDALDHLRKAGTVEVVYRDDPYSQEWRTQATAIMIRSETRITAQDLSQVKQLRVIVKQGVGVDNIDLEAAKDHGIIVCNTPALNSESVAELTLTLALCVARRVNEVDRRIRRGETIVRSSVLGQSLFRKKIGVVGMGNIGKIVAEKWIAAMSGEVIAYDPFVSKDSWREIQHRRVDDLDTLLRESDVVTLHVPLTDGTRNMIDRAQLALMKKTAILLNCARGGILNESALLDALKAGDIYGAALDAMSIEPATLKAYGELLSHENLIMTPHVGANTVENQVISGTAVAQTVLDVLNGKEVPNRLV